MSTKAFSDEVSKLLPILRALSDRDALRILLEASKGLPSGLEAPRSLGMTKRRYYMRLKELVDLGLLKKKEDSYCPTVIGKVATRVLYEELLKVLPHAQILENLSDLGLNSFENIRKLMPELSRDEAFSLSHILEPRVTMDIITRYDDLVAKVCKEIENANSSLLFASKYLDLSVSKSLLDIQEKNITMYILVEFDLSEVLSFMRNFLTHFRLSASALKLLSSGKVSFRKGSVPMSFLIVNGKRCLLELLPQSKEFEIAILVDDKRLIDRMTGIFWKSWGRSTPITPSIMEAVKGISPS
jgi:predicted transcriptional regulator